MTPAPIIFDCDGVLVDSEPLSMRVDVEILSENGVVMSLDEAHHRFVGKTFAAMLDEVEREFGVRFPPDASADKDRRLLDLFARELQPVPGVKQAMSAIGGRFSVASNSPAERVAEALRITGLAAFFDSRITTFEHVKRGKPAPDVFIEAARRENAAPSQCIVIEDSVTGVTAAATAGCRTLGFVGTHPEPALQAERLKKAGAVKVFETMDVLPRLVSEILPQPQGML